MKLFKDEMAEVGMEIGFIVLAILALVIYSILCSGVGATSIGTLNNVTVSGNSANGAAGYANWPQGAQSAYTGSISMTALAGFAIPVVIVVALFVKVSKQ